MVITLEPSYEIVPHTAEVAVRCRAASFGGLLIEAGRALAEIQLRGTADRLVECGEPAHVEDGLVLARERSGGKILGSGAGPDRDVGRLLAAPPGRQTDSARPASCKWLRYAPAVTANPSGTRTPTDSSDRISSPSEAFFPPTAGTSSSDSSRNGMTARVTSRLEPAEPPGRASRRPG